MTVLALSAIGADRPGIVAGVSRVILETGGTIEDASMTILRGHFAMTLVVAADRTADAVRAALETVARDLDLVVDVREIADDYPTAPARAPYIVSVYGADRPGIVAGVTGLLAARGVNITDLRTRLSGGDLYLMVIEVDVPAAQPVDDLAGALARLGAELGVEATIHPADADIL